MEHLKTIRDDRLPRILVDKSHTLNTATDRLLKCNDERIQFDEQVACYNLYEAIRGVKLLTKEEESNNTSKEIFKLLEDFEKKSRNRTNRQKKERVSYVSMKKGKRKKLINGYILVLIRKLRN